MKRGIIIASIILLMGLHLYSSVGVNSADFLNYSPSARGTAMADAYTSVVDDAYASYYNPSALSNIEQLEFAATYNKSFEGITNQFVSICSPLKGSKSGEVLGLSYSNLSYGNIDGYDASGVKTGRIDAQSRYLGFSYSRVITKDEIERPVFNVGGSLKYINENLDTQGASSLAIDLGASYSLRPLKYWLKEIPAQEFRFSAALRNLGPGLKFDKESSPLPISLTLGASWISYPFGSHRLILSIDNVISNYDKFTVNLGAEYFLFQLVGVRAGITSSKYIGSRISFGVGFKLSFIDIDYSMVGFGELGSMNRVNLVMRFGERSPSQPLKGEVRRVEKAKLVAPKERVEELEMFANDYINLAEKNIQDRDFVAAINNLNKAFNLDPSLKKGKWGLVEKNLSTLNSYLRFDKMGEKIEKLKEKNEQANLGFETIKAFINGNYQKAYLLAHITYGTNVKEKIYEEILKAISDILRLNIRRDELLPEKSWITQKLKRMAAYFYSKQYDLVIKEGEEIILVDENNALCLTRMGSAYFMLGDRENAKKSYLKALEINPDDEITKRFVQEQGWK